MLNHVGARATKGCSRGTQAIVIAAVAGGLGGGCDVIKPELLVADAAPMMGSPAPVDAAIPRDAPELPPDAYQPAIGNLVTNADFEAQGKTGWITDGAGVIDLSTGNAHAGAHCLVTTERTDYWQGPATAITTKVRPGRKYAMSVFVRLMAAGSEGFNLSLRHTCQQQFNIQTDRQTAVATDNTTWVQPTSTFTVAPAATCTLTEVLVYVETATKLTAGSAYPSFYIDDIDVSEVSP